MRRVFFRTQPTYIHRERIDALLESGMDYPLVSVIAAPGYGKTEAVAAFAQKLHMPVLWLCLQETDNDPACAWQHFIRAAEHEVPELAKQLSRIEMPFHFGRDDFFSRALERQLEQSHEMLIVIDNFSNIHEANVVNFFRSLTQLSLRGLHLIVISNRKNVHDGFFACYPQWRLTEDDLKFDEEEAIALFGQNKRTDTVEQIREMLDYTDGWSLALNIISNTQQGEAVAAQYCPVLQQLTTAVFEQSAFEQYDSEFQRLLIRLSSLISFPLELIACLNAEQVLAFSGCIFDNPFIFYDPSTELFRFQKMYRAFLLHRRAVISEEKKTELYSFMGNWFLKRSLVVEALDCFWRVHDYEKCLMSIAAMPRTRKTVIDTSKMLHILKEFPEDVFRSNPLLRFSKAVLTLNALDTQTAQTTLIQLVDELEAIAEKSEEDRLLLGDCYIVLADISFLLGRDDGLQYMKRAAHYLPNGGRVRTQDLDLIGNNFVFYLPDNSAGQLRRMVEYYFEYATYADIACNGSGFGLEWIFAAQAEFYVENYEKARENSFQAIAKARSMQQHDIICNSFWDLARLELYLGNYHAAKRWIEELGCYVTSRQITTMYELRDCAESWFYTKMEDFERVAPWVADDMPMQWENILEVGRNRLIVVGYLSAVGRHSEAYAELSQLEEVLRLSGRWQIRLQLLLQKTLRLLDYNAKEEAVAVFKEAYEMVYQNNITVPLAERGKAMQRIIRTVGKQTAVEFDMEWLGQINRKAGAFEKRLAAMRKKHRGNQSHVKEQRYHLNAREKEILIHMAHGMTREEISLHMATSVSNVKRYINNIYTKLGALNRADAIHIATRDGLLNDGAENQ